MLSPASAPRTAPTQLRSPCAGASSIKRRRQRSNSLRSDPTAVARGKDCLGAVDGTDLAVDVVKMGANGRDRKVHFAGDLLVDHSLGEVAEDVELAGRQRAGLADAGGVLGRQRQLVEEVAQTGFGEAAALGGSA